MLIWDTLYILGRILNLRINDNVYSITSSLSFSLHTSGGVYKCQPRRRQYIPLSYFYGSNKYNDGKNVVTTL